MYSPSEKNPFKSEGGVYYLKPIFYEHDLSENKDVALYTLKDQDHEVNGKVYPSLRRLYIETGDLTEYEFVNLFLGGWPHWKRLQACTWFQPYLEEWREELEVKLRSEALAKVVDISKAKQHPSHYQAAKYVVDKGWQPKEKQQTGPKTREKIREEAEKIHNSNVEVLEDWKRIKGEN
jgi:hypothetical protein